MKKIENRIVIVTRETRLEKVLSHQNTLSQARFWVRSRGADFGEYENEHNSYGRSVRFAKQQLDAVGKIQPLDRRYLPNFIFAPDDIVVAIGQDGLVANILKYLDGQPLIGVNPDPALWDGVLLPFTPENAARIVVETSQGRRKREEVTMASARTQDGQELLAVNDFFIGQRGHASARYVIKYGGVKEPQSSSGVIVSTGLGSTGWMKSVIAGAKGISASVIGSPYKGKISSEDLSEEDEEYYAALSPRRMAFDMMSAEPVNEICCMANEIGEVREFEEDYLGDDEDEIDEFDEDEVNMCYRYPPPPRQKTAAALKSARKAKPKKDFGFSELESVVGKWSSRELLFAVREPFPSKTTGTNLIFGKVEDGEILKIESLMGEDGVIFSDGIESDYIEFNSGTEAVITLAKKKGLMVV